MDLLSCKSCGVVLDKEVLDFTDDIYDEEGCIDDAKAFWNGDDYVSFIKCPCCGTNIDESGDTYD